MEAERKKSQNEINNLKNAHTKDNTDLQKQIAAANDKAKKAESNSEDLEEQLKKAKSSLAESNALNKKLEGKMNELKNSVGELETKNASSEDQAHKQAATLKQLRDTIESQTNVLGFMRPF